jgi:hypothetical protein
MQVMSRDVNILILPNVKEHAPLSAGASVDHGVDVETTGEHANRAANRGCCVSACSISSFIGSVNRDDLVVAGKDNVEGSSEQRVLCHPLTRLKLVVASPPGLLRANVVLGIER